MAISYQGTSVATGTSSASVSAPASIATGDVMVCVKADRATSGTTTAPTGWTRVGSAAGTSGRIEVFWGAYGYNSIGSGPWSFTGSTRTLARIVSYSGVNYATPMDVTPTARYNASGTTGTTSITTATDGAMIVAGFASLTANYTWSAEACATSPTITERIESAYSTYLDVAVADGSKSSAGSTGASSGTMSTSANNAAVLVALRPSLSYAQSVDGGVTPAGVIGRSAGKPLAGGATPNGGYAGQKQQQSKAVDGGLTPAGAASKALARAPGGGMTPIGSAAKTLSRALTGGL